MKLLKELFAIIICLISLPIFLIGATIAVIFALPMLLAEALIKDTETDKKVNEILRKVGI